MDPDGSAVMSVDVKKRGCEKDRGEISKDDKGLKGFMF